MHEEQTDRAQSQQDGVADLHGNELFATVYHELRSVARIHMGAERPDHTLQTTALVHEAYVRLANEGRTQWANVGEFMIAAAEAMRRILIDRARARKTKKRGGDHRRAYLNPDEVLLEDRIDELLHLDEALEALEAHNSQWAMVVKLRYFAGLTHEQTAESLELPEHSARRKWHTARAWLHAEIKRRHGPQD
ncbi:MAG: sigma-70 family RNA polymerase sigma factor [Phycisphaeraceae bacterium]|nr:MAG: sigma-70 family RNA polymerase sigma factor [Phycisphaeraceae bacterium]